MKKTVHIKVSDKGWILERLASEISNRLPYVSYGIEDNTSAEIQYYMTYGCRQERVSPIEIALFTHKEEVPSAAAKFDAVASAVDFCVAQSIKTESILRENGLANIKTISPGVDLNKFSPLVRIGVVGRTYHTGRKGEKIVAQVMDIPGIEWHFTGEGWPGPAQYIDEDNLPNFYRTLDYILVPALIEGGPMCVLEALASGCKVIASPVGWVPQFPHLEFKLGDAEDLRRVLLLVLEEKNALRKSVESYTWQSWADQHHELFCQLLKRDLPREKVSKTETLSLSEPSYDEPLSKDFRALVAVHGQEMTTSFGGPSVRAPKTVNALRKIGVDAEFAMDRNFFAEEFDVIHALNVWHPSECERLLKQVEKNNRPTVLSPIFLDLSEIGFYNQRVKNILSTNTDIVSVKNELSVLKNDVQHHRKKPMVEREPLPNYFSAVRRLVSFSNHLILLSELEENLLKQIGVSHPSTSIVKNPVDMTVFNQANPQLFREHIGIENYVLCVGRIEPRKNQALLALALRDTTLPLVFIGHEADDEYAELIRKWGGSNVFFAGRIEPNSLMLASAFAGAKVFCLPSWSEGAPLVALEAAGSGCNMVLSNRSSEEEYFGELARYVDPADVEDIRTKILLAWEDSQDVVLDRAKQLKEKMRTQHSWESYAVQTKKAYEAAIKAKPVECNTSTNLSVTPAKRRVFIDLTTVAHHKGPPTGITRVELCIAEAFHELYGDEVHYIVWNSHHRKFIRVNYSVVEDDSVKLLSEINNINYTVDGPEHDCLFNQSDVLLVFGSAWIRNLNYIRSLKTLKLKYNVSIVSAVYDVIEYKMKFMFSSERRHQFSLNCSELLKISDKVITCSEQSRSDLIDFCLNTGTPLCPISVFRLGDEPVHRELESKDENIIEAPSELLSTNRYVLYVSTLNIRKNHIQLLMLWKSLINQYGDAVPILVLVGSVGWGGEEALDIIDNTPSLKEKIIVLHDINDVTLSWLYQNCLFTVYPSRYEGWGLPVAESCCYGKFCLASNAGSLPEVAPDCAEFLDPMDSISWYKALEKYCFDSEHLAKKTELAKTYQPTTWHTTAKQVTEAIVDINYSERVASLAVGDTVSFAENPQPGMLKCNEFILTGWANNESGGTWTAGHEAVLGFQLDQDVSGKLAVRLSAFAFSPDGDSVRADISVNGIAAAKWEVDGAPIDFLIPIPSEAIKMFGNIIISIKLENVKSPSQFGSADMRILGLHVIQLALIEYHEFEVLGHAINDNSSEANLIELQKPTIARKIVNRIRKIKSAMNNA